MADTAATIFAVTPVCGVDLDAKGSTFAFPALMNCFGNDGRKHTVALAGGTLSSTANMTIGTAGSAISAASVGVATYTVNTTGGVVAGQYFFARQIAI